MGYGHGIAVTPLHLATGYATLFNGGVFHPARLLKVDRNHPVAQGHARLLRRDQLQDARALRLVVRKAPARRRMRPAIASAARRAPPKSFSTADTPRSSVVTTFAGVFPMDEPRYVIVVMLDEPKPTKDTYGFHTAGWNVAPVVSRTVSRIAPMLGVRPDKNREPDMSEVLPFVHETKREGLSRCNCATSRTSMRFRSDGLRHRSPQGRSREACSARSRAPCSTARTSSIRRSSGARWRSSRGRKRDVERVLHLSDAEPRRLFAELAAKLLRALSGNGRRRDGTNGKTSTVEMTRQIWRMSGHRSASIGTLGVTTSDDQVKTGLTTPDIVTFLSNMAGLKRMGIEPCRLRGLVPRPRPASRRRRAAGRRGLHQLQPRSPRLSRHDGRLFRGQDAVVRASCCQRGGRQSSGPTIPSPMKSSSALAPPGTTMTVGRKGETIRLVEQIADSARPDPDAGAERQAASSRAAADRRLPSGERPDRRGPRPGDRRGMGCDFLCDAARVAGSRAARARGDQPRGRSRLHRLCPHARCARSGDCRASSACRGPVDHGIRRRRRPRPGQAAGNGRGRGRACRTS